MAYGVIRTDLMSGTKQPADLVSLRFYNAEGKVAEVENGVIVELKGYEDGQREVMKAVAATSASDIDNCAVVAGVEVMYDERKKNLDEYINGALGNRTVTDQSEEIPQRERSREYLMLYLRTTRGIEEWEYRRTYFMNFDTIEVKLAEFEHRGWATRSGNRWRLTPEGFLISNRLIVELQERQEEAGLANTLERLKRGTPGEEWK